MKNLWLVFVLSICCVSGFGQKRKSSTVSMETLINHYITHYPLSTNNLFRLCSYAELKGDYSVTQKSLTLDFGYQGAMAFYPKNFLLRLGNGQVFNLDKKEKNPDVVKAVDDALNKIFESIPLLGNYNADQAHLEFVDAMLSRKNIEPFEKVYTRHILVKYGKFYPEKSQVEFHTDWLPEKSFEYLEPGQEDLVRRYSAPLRLLLDSVNLRGYYVSVGGFVYVENVKRKVGYATGEQYLYNVSAFKLFIQKLFVQTTQYVTQTVYSNREEIRSDYNFVKKEYIRKPENPEKLIELAKKGENGRSERLLTVLHGSFQEESPISMLYGKYTWIPTMLARLRSHNIKLYDPTVLNFLVDQPYFDRIYQYMNEHERGKVDTYINKRKSRGNKRKA